MSARGITIIGASAGSGKTYRLTQEVTRAIHPNALERVDLEGLVAVTYTRKAHAELAARIRQTLVKAGAFDEAVRLPVAYLGTVHAACLRLLQEFALDAGLSPNVDVVAGDQAKLLRESLEQSVGTDRCAELDRLAASFELLWQPKLERHDWLRPVTDIMDLARGNRIHPDALPAMAERSVASFLRLLPPVAPDGALLDACLARAMAAARANLGASSDRTKVTRAALDLIDECGRRLGDGELRWRHWEKLARLEPAKASAALVVELQSAAAAYASHPRLHEEITAMTRAVYAAAQAGLAGYEAWKAERRVVDYVDMISLALEVVDHPRASVELTQRLRLVVVDEFQDTSPIQLALFLRLHALAGRSTWVGDRKQCIFEYAGADPALMDSVAAWVEASGGARDRLRDNYRSRPELVRACSELFAAALLRHGFPREEVMVDPVREAHPALDTLPPLGLFCLETETKHESAEALAEGVRRLVADPAGTLIVDRDTKVARGLRPGDVAVLVATNAEARQIANALHARGVRVALARAGLLSTPEGTLADAALRALLDARDTLSAATLDALTGFGGGSPDSWLEATIRARRVEPSEGEAPLSGWRAALERVRTTLGVLSPREALDETLSALDVVHLCARWPDSPQRIANIDALRALAAAYEERCRQEREAGTVAGLLRHFDDLRTETLRRDELLAADEQHVSADGDAVTVCTYHKSKGLEWPVVVLASLDRAERRDAFDVRPESDRAERDFDPEKPLEGRWIRFWPWPLGALDKAPLAEAAERSAEGQRVADREERERVRLLYVGFTRARDHLVLAVRVAKGKAKTAWLDTLASAAGDELLVLPAAARDGATDTTVVRCADGASLDVRTRVWRLGAQPGTTVEQPKEPPTWYSRSAGQAARGGYWIAPSRAADEWPDVAPARIGAVEQHAAAIRLEKDLRHDVLGNAVHGFLAADVEGLSPSARSARAGRLLAAAGMSGIVEAGALLGASDALRSWVERRWPDASWRREITIEAVLSSPHGERRVSGTIDLLLETAQGRVLIDHKTFPGATEPAWRARVKGFLPQMAAYADAVSRLDDRPLIACWVHLPMGGGMVEIVRAARAPGAV